MQNTNFNSWTDAVLATLSSNINALISYLPNLFGAVIIFTVGWIVAGLVKRLFLKALDILQLEPFAEKVGISNVMKRAGASISPAELLSEIVKWGIVIAFLNPTVEILGLSQATELINEVLRYIPNVIVAALILMFGVIFADLTGHFVRGAASALNTGAANTIETITRYSIIVFVFLAALSQLGIAEDLVQTLFTGFVAMIAIAGGLSFGLGGKDLAADLLNSLRHSLHNEEKRKE
ncbi:hypothetical protein HGA91_02945 [candidate division WWE3 bacterium]|nr:hypothetical protein [candidate division WWE3 bacterium]